MSGVGGGSLMSDIFLTEINEKLKLYQKRGGLTFGTDAYLLSAYMKKRHTSVAVELGSGTGVISLLCASRGDFAKIYALELQPEFAALCEKNIKENALDGRVVSLCRDIRQFAMGDITETVETVFANPPYMRADSGRANEKSEKQIARHEVHGSIYDFAACAARVLKHGGYFYTVYRPDRLIELIAALRENKLEPKRMTFVHARSGLAPCLVLVESKLGAAASLSVTPPLIMYKQMSEYTSELNYIYENGEFNEQYQKA